MLYYLDSVSPLTYHVSNFSAAYTAAIHNYSCAQWQGAHTTSQEEPSDFRDEEGEIEEFMWGKRHMKSKGNHRHDRDERKSTNSLHKATQLLNVHSWISE